MAALLVYRNNFAHNWPHFYSMGTIFAHKCHTFSLIEPCPSQIPHIYSTVQYGHCSVDFHLAQFILNFWQLAQHWDIWLTTHIWDIFAHTRVGHSGSHFVLWLTSDNLWLTSYKCRLPSVKLLLPCDKLWLTCHKLWLTAGKLWLIYNKLGAI